MKLVILTTRFPYTPGEEFFEGELSYLSKIFDITLVPSSFGGEARKLAVNVAVDSGLALKLSGVKNKLVSLFANPISFISIFIHVKKSFDAIRKPVLKDYLVFLNEALRASIIANYLKVKNYSKESVFYSYWMIDTALALSYLKEKKIVKRFFTRAHGYDLYDERRDYGFIPSRSYILKNTDGVLCISEDGRRYLQNKYSIYQEKIKLSRLGTRNNNFLPSVSDKKGTINIVSCSYLVKLKRVHLIAEVLKNLDLKVSWTHIGGGPLEDSIKQLISELPENITVTLTGNLANHEVNEIYRTNNFDVFIHVSETEGLPVSFMEAMSFGIPVVATAVGGVPEIVTSETGLLIDKNFNPKECAMLINESIEKFRNIDYRMGVFNYWYENFSSDRNYKNLTSYIEGLGNEKL